MDMSFARRRKATHRSESPDLLSLLAAAGAQQASTRTAKIQARVATDQPRTIAQPLVEIFAPEGEQRPGTHRFNDFVEIPVTKRQPK